MFNVGSGEFLVIFLIALIVLGPDRLPDAARKVGKVVGDLRKMSSGFQQEMRQAMDVDGLKEALDVDSLKKSLMPNMAPTLPPLSSASSSTDDSPSTPAPAPAASPDEIAGAAPVTGAGLKPVPNDASSSDPPAKGQQGAA
ncbi:MAG: twin-arginine translocase subunit TatB [Actinobacteria bacterium]|nr:twin-arginine translocase subunit TatB [Actinomycetota bacterium]